MLIRLCRLFFFCNEERKDDLVRYPGGLFFSLVVKENYSLHSLREKSIIPNKSQSCCPLFSAEPCGTLGDVDFMSYALPHFFFQGVLGRPPARRWSDFGGVDVARLTAGVICQGAARMSCKMLLLQPEIGGASAFVAELSSPS